jgi:hypothetical protein
MSTTSNPRKSTVCELLFFTGRRSMDRVKPQKYHQPGDTILSRPTCWISLINSAVEFAESSLSSRTT